MQGILMGFLLEWSASPWICIAAHMAANLPAFFLTNVNSCPVFVILMLEAFSAGLVCSLV